MNDFHQNGFCLLKNELNPVELRLLENEYDRLIKEAEGILEHTIKESSSLASFYKTHPDSLIVVPEISSYNIPCRFEYIAGCSEIITDHIIEKLRFRINGLMGQPFVLFKDKCNVKNPGGGAFTPHQDFSAYYHFPPKFHVTAAVILDDSTVENGCLEVALDYRECISPSVDMVSCQFGSFPFFDFYHGGNHNGDIKREVSAQFKWMPIEAKKGDVLLFDSFLPHCSKKNNSNHCRRNLFFTFNSFLEGDWYKNYYELKRNEFSNPIFHVSTPTEHQENRNEA